MHYIFLFVPDNDKEARIGAEVEGTSVNLKIETYQKEKRIKKLGENFSVESFD